VAGSSVLWQEREGERERKREREREREEGTIGDARPWCGQATGMQANGRGRGRGREREREREDPR